MVMNLNGPVFYVVAIEQANPFVLTISCCSAARQYTATRNKKCRNLLSKVSATQANIPLITFPCTSVSLKRLP